MEAWIVATTIARLIQERDEARCSAEKYNQAMLEFAPSRMAAFAVIDGFADLPPTWGGPDTVLPSVQTRAATKALLMGLPPAIAAPHVSPSADGEIGLTWVMATKRVDALLDADGHLVWFWTRHDSRINPGGEVTYDGAFPDELLAVLEIAVLERRKLLKNE